LEEGQAAVRTRREHGKAVGLVEAPRCRYVGDAKEEGRMEQHSHLPFAHEKAAVPAGERLARPFRSGVVVAGKLMPPATWATLARSLVFSTTSGSKTTQR
jgi:hypothetical protein